MLVLAQGQQAESPVVFVDHALLRLPDVKVLLAHGEQHRYVLPRDYVALAETRVLGNAGDYLGHVVADDAAHGLPRIYQLHGRLLTNQLIL